MHIDFAPPSNGIYNNAGSCRQLANYMEHEDLKRIEKSIYTEGFFNLTDDNIYKSTIIKDIDSNIGQLLKTDAKFYAIHVSPSEKELRAMGNTEQEQAEAMKLYIREVFIPEYANNFNKGLSEADIKFYGKIHFDRSRSNNELNMHCHLIVSRKDQTNKKKLSPLTNHKNTQKGMVTGGFDRVKLFQQAERGFDKLLGYSRQQTELFDYYNIMKNSSVFEQLKLQEQELHLNERKAKNNNNHIHEILPSLNLSNNRLNNRLANPDTSTTIKQRSNTSANPPFNSKNDYASNSFISIVSSETVASVIPEAQLPKSKKKKRKRHKT